MKYRHDLISGNCSKEKWLALESEWKGKKKNWSEYWKKELKNAWQIETGKLLCFFRMNSRGDEELGRFFVYKDVASSIEFTC